MPKSFEPKSIDIAQRAISGQISAIHQTERLSLHQTGGRILAADIPSPKDVPEHPLSAMDGYSLSSQALNKAIPQIPLTLQVLGKSLAGHSLQGQAKTDACVRIFTGAVVPAGHDTVIAQELVQVSQDGSTISFDAKAVKPFANVRARGEDLRLNDAALSAGTIIGPREIALLASIGIGQIQVVRQVRVAVLSTGDEVVEPGAPLNPGKTFDANRPMILEMVRNAGAQPLDLGIVRDDAQSLETAIRHAAEVADAVITSGGVSVGEADHTRQVMQSLGEIEFWKLAIKPGRPLAAGWVQGRPSSKTRVPFFGLPGNPVAAFVTFTSVVLPCLQKLSGATPQSRPPIRARLAQPAKKVPGRTEYLRCALRRDAQGEWIAEIAASQGAASLKSLVDADGLVVLPHDAGPMEAGTAVDVIVLR